MGTGVKYLSRGAAGFVVNGEMSFFASGIVRRVGVVGVLACLSVAALGAGAWAQGGAGKPAAGIQDRLDAVAKQAEPGTFGIAVVDLQSGARWGVNGERSFPMMSDCKAPVAAAVLSRVDAGTLSLRKKIVLRRADVVPGSAVPSIGDKLRGEQMTVTVGELVVAAVKESDNTAVDALLRLLGGGEAVTAFLQAQGIAGMQVGTGEGAIAGIFENLHGAAAPPAGETAAQTAEREEAGYRAFMAAPPNHTTPDAAALFLKKLWGNELLSHGSTQYLLGLMYAQVVNRMRDGLPPGTRMADKTGTSGTVNGFTAAYNDMGLITWPDGQAVIVAGYLTGSHASKVERDALFAELARETVAALHPAM